MKYVKSFYLFCAISLVLLREIHGDNSLMQLAKMAGIDLKEIGAEHLMEGSPPTTSMPSIPKPSSSNTSPTKEITKEAASVTGPLGIGSTVAPSLDNIMGHEMSPSSFSSLANIHGIEMPPEFASPVGASKPSCGGCGKPGCPECGGRLGLGMSPDFGGEAMASGVEGMEGIPGMDGVGFEQMNAMGSSSGFIPAMNGFGGQFGGYGAPAASFLSPSALNAFGMGGMGGMGGFRGGFGGGFGGSEMNPMMGSGFATFPIHAPVEPYPMRASGSGRGRGRRGRQHHRPQPQPQHDDNNEHESHSQGPPPPPQHYDGPQNEGGYDHGPQQGGNDDQENDGPSSYRQEYDSSPSHGSYSHGSSYQHQSPNTGSNGYDYEQ